MSDPNLQPEPTMEEILASIRRIISEDQQEDRAPARPLAQGGPGARGPDTPETVLELTDVVGEEAVVRDSEPAAPPTPPAAADRDALVSEPAARQASAAFVDLAEELERARGRAPGAGSLEAIVADLLRPLLREWLDAHLPALVERLVEREIARLAGRGEDEQAVDLAPPRA